MASSRQFLVTLLLCVGGFATAGYAGPPFFTDDPEPVELHNWEFYIATLDSKFGHDFSGTAPHFELNYGAVPDLQLHIIAPLAFDYAPDGNFKYGIGDIELGAKYRFIHETDHIPQVGIFPLLEVPTGSFREGLGNGHTQAFLPLWIQKSWGDDKKWMACGGGGYGINSFSGRGNWGFFGAVLQRQITKNFALGAEIYHQTVYETDFPNVGTGFNVGAIIDLNEHNHLLLSAGRSIDGPINFQFYVAYQFTFDNDFFGWFGKHIPG